jgi:hypothetical protein
MPLGDALDFDRDCIDRLNADVKGNRQSVIGKWHFAV